MGKATLVAITMLMGSVVYTGTAEQVEGVLTDAQMAASVMQVHQLELALEFYHLDHGHYPKVSGAKLDRVLHEGGYLRERTVPFDVEYTVATHAQSYELRVRPEETINIDN